MAKKRGAAYASVAPHTRFNRNGPPLRDSINLFTDSDDLCNAKTQQSPLRKLEISESESGFTQSKQSLPTMMGPGSFRLENKKLPPRSLKTTTSEV